MDLNKEDLTKAEPAIDETPAAEMPQRTPWVSFVVLGGDTQELDFTPGMTVGQVLRATGRRIERGNVIQVNGAPATEDTVLDPNSVVQLTSRVKNG